MKLTGLAITVLLFGNLAHAGWVSIAYSKTTGKAGSNNASVATADESRKLAITDCGQADCTIVIATTTKVAAIAVDSRGSVFTSDSDSVPQALQMAFDKCGGMTNGCRWRYYQTNTQEKDNQWNEPDAGPNLRTPLASVGKINAGLNSITGFRQVGENTCWAAGLSTMVSAKFGISLSQWALGQLQTGGEPESSEPAAVAAIPVSVNHECNPQTHEGCDHGNTPLPIANVLGTSLPIQMYPQTTDGAAFWKTVQASFKAGMPVGLVIRWYNGGSHLVVLEKAVLGTSANENPNQPHFALTVFDPEDGSTNVMTSNEYLPAYEKIPGRFTGQIVVMNYLNPSAIINSRLCKFVESDPQGLCH